MKKLFLVSALIAISVASYAQHTTSREAVFGVSDASAISFKTATVADTLGATVDSIFIRPNARTSYYHVNVKDSSSLYLKSLATCYYGDELYLDIVNPTITGNFINLLGGFVVSTGTTKIALTSAKSSYLKFWFNGADWVEAGRNLNYTR